MSHIVLPDAYPCAFCDYLSGERPYTILLRDDLAAVLVTREQRGVSHVLVIPIRHVPTVLDLHDAEAHAVMDLTRRVASAIDQADGRPGISIWQNNGVAAQQAIPHFHIHVAGTVQGGGTEWDEVDELTVEDTDKIADHLRPYL
ncbi:HIT family protein [Nocardioides yefusunii]|uniref:HIT family protein n=1 Tax=Nocardioides yefusunii TaxID=2500546 RepID=A0ABW1QY17_9ACTN|nr:HIT domain-containing protein [Nocardioides yefusunii]